MLKKDQEQYERELQEKQIRPDVSDLKAAKEYLVRQREAERKKEAEEKMLQHWKLNNPEFRELQLKKHKEIIQKSWEEERERREKEKEEQRLRDQEEMALRMKEEMKKEFDDQKLREQKEKEVIEWRNTIKAQIEELRAKKEAEKRLKSEISVELDAIQKAFEAERRRERDAKRRRNAEIG